MAEPVVVSPAPPTQTTSDKTWTPLIIGCSVAIAYITGKAGLRLTYADASMLSDAIVAAQALIMPMIVQRTRNRLKTPVEIVTPVGMPNVLIPAEKSHWWHGVAKYGGWVAAIALGAVLVWRFL